MNTPRSLLGATSAAALIILGVPDLSHAQGAAGTISTFAGTGVVGSTGDGGPATSARLFSPSGVTADRAGNVYIAETGSHRIRKVTPAGVISTFAGTGSRGFSGDGGPATSAALSLSPSGHQGLAVDSDGNLYIPDHTNQRVRKVDSSGVISTVAGTGSRGSSGDGGPATAAGLTDPIAVAFDGAGNLYIAEFAGNRVRKVDRAGVITTAAGGGRLGSGNGDGGPATSAILNAPLAIAVDHGGNLYIADATAARVRKVDVAGTISTAAGSGARGSAGDGGPATGAAFDPTGVAVDGAGRLYISERTHRIRRVTADGIINTIAGTGEARFSGDGGPAASASFSSPADLAFDSAGNLYVADTLNSRVRKITGVSAPAVPAVSGVVNGASFQSGIVANSWVTVQGSNLSSVTDTWANAIVDGKLPTRLAGVTVTIAGKPAYLYYVSPNQINLVAPDSGSGPVEVVVTNAEGTSQALTVTSSRHGPAYLTWSGNQVVATRQDFSLAVKDGTFPTATVAAKPGDVLILWGTGFGPTTPAAPMGVQLPANQTYSTSSPPVVTINNVPATVYGAALAPGFAGLYQVAIQVPASLANGDWPLVASIGGVQSPGGVVLSVRQ